MKNIKRVLSVLLTLAMLLSCVPVLAQATESVDFANLLGFDLYSSSSGGFQLNNGRLTPTGEAGEFKAIYKDSGEPIKAVSVEMHPNGNDGMYGGLYIGASNPANGQDLIDAYYIGIESHFSGWDDAPNRLDITLGKFTQGWAGEVGARVVSETGNGNNLFTGGNKQPIKICAEFHGNVVNVTVSLVSDPSRQVSTVYTLPEGTDLSMGDVGIRSQYNYASYDNFTVEYVGDEPVETVDSQVIGFENTNAFDLYSASAGGFVAENGKLVPTGDAGEFKAIYKNSGAVNTVSVEIHPVGNDGPIFGGLYIGASNAANAQDAINGLYIGVESHFTGWDDAANRADLVIGQFPTWHEHARTVSETGANNNLFTGGIKEPVVLKAEISGNTVVATLSLLRDPSVSISATYTADRDLSQGQVGIRSHHNNAMFDNFAVNAVENAHAAFVSFDNASAFALYSTSEGRFAAENGKLVPTGDAGEFKAIYSESGKAINSVSVELHPVGNDGPIYGGLYVGASNAAHGQDSINALYIGIESHFTGWEDAPNRVDLVIGQFPTWKEHARTVSETGANNNLFTGGVKEPLVLRAEINGNTVTATVSLKSDPSKSVSATYTADYDLSTKQVGIRSHHNNAMYDNFAVNSVAYEDVHGYATLAQAVRKAEGRVVTVLCNTDEVFTVTGDATIDLAGHTLTGVITTEDSSLKIVDSAATYEATKGSAVVVGPVEVYGEANGQTYLTYAVEGVHSAHPYAAELTHISLDPAKDALGYKASLKGDELVQSLVTGFGIQLWVNDFAPKSYTVTGKQDMTLRLKNILANDGGEMNISAAAEVNFAVGETTHTQTSAAYTTTMKETLQMVDSVWNSYTIEQQDAVLALCEQYRNVVENWELNNIFFEGVNFADPLSRGETKYTFATTDTYQNGQDIAGQWGQSEFTAEGEYGIGDPFVMKYNGKYYMYPSSSTAENGVTGVKVFSSDDLVNWTYEGFALEAVEADRAYAPEVLYYNGWFLMCQSGSAEVDGVIKGGQGHYIYKSQSPLGPFELMTEDFDFGIDGSLWIDDNGELFFLYAYKSSIRIIPMDMDNMRPVSVANSHKVLNATLPGGTNKWVEGPGLFRRGDYLYLTYSGNRVTEDTYRVGYSYLIGSNPMTEDFIQPEDNVLMLKTGPDNFRGLGHNSNVLGPNLDSWYAAYHNLLGVDGPQRRYMLDQLVTNGSQVLANGPTYWSMPVPERPDLEIRNVESGWFSEVNSESVYTVEFNFIPADCGISMMAFGYVDENNYRVVTWDDSEKVLSVISIVDGEQTVLGSATVDFLMSEALHTVRIEQGGNRLLVYIDTMRKIDLAVSGIAGQIGVAGDATWEYIAMSNDALGTSDFDTVKVVEGAFPAVHYLKGEYRGFYIANAQVTNGIRQGEKENTVNNDGVYSLKLDTAGDWVKYAIAVNGGGLYDLSADFTADEGTIFQVIVDGQDIYEIDLATVEGDVLSQLELAPGNHTLKIRLREGSLQVQTFAITASVAE
ncbi:MAG: family 43 glycosylhydrolase [Oscillospiraceae bacterium]|nr:family 43 glycosylhydrolase [Oscillospiraceae bacterium]